MKYLVILALFALASIVSCKPVAKEGDKAFDASVDLLKRTLASLAATEEGPFFTLVKTHSVTLTPSYAYPILITDVKDQQGEEQYCQISLFTRLDIDDAKFKVNFECDEYESTKNVVLNQ